MSDKELFIKTIDAIDEVATTSVNDTLTEEPVEEVTLVKDKTRAWRRKLTYSKSGTKQRKGKTKKREYTGVKAIDKTCRNHGSDKLSKENRLYSSTKRESRSKDAIKEHLCEGI